MKLIDNPYDTERDKETGLHYGEGRVWNEATDAQLEADQQVEAELQAEIDRLKAELKLGNQMYAALIDKHSDVQLEVVKLTRKMLHEIKMETT